MRYLISLLFITVFAFASNAQVQYREGFDRDTVDNTETVYLYPGGTTAATAPSTAAAAVDFKEFGALSVNITADSLSGANAGSAILQGCYDDACTYTYDIATITLNGATQQVSNTEDSEFAFRKFRVKATRTGTMSTKLQMYYVWKRKT